MPDVLLRPLHALRDLRAVRCALLAVVLVFSVSARASGSEPAADRTPPPPPDGWFARYIHELIHGPADPTKPRFLVYPVVAFAPETRLEVGVSGLYVFRARRDLDNRLSEFPIYAFGTMNQQFGITFEHVIFSHKSRYSMLGEGILAYFPLKYFGIGPDTRYEDEVIVNARQIALRERLLFKLGPTDLYLGPEVALSALGHVDFEAPDGRSIDTLPRGGDGTTNVSVGAGIAFDTRHNPLNVRDGWFGELAFLGSRAGLASEYSFHNVFLDLRTYRPLDRSKSVVLAGQVLGQFGGGELPFNELALVGGPSMMRGYYLGRYRDRHMSAAQLELRVLPLPLGFTRRVGVAAFVASGTVFPSWSRLRESKPRVTAGGGLRLLTFPSSDIYTRVEVGVSEDGPGYYVYVGEAF